MKTLNQINEVITNYNKLILLAEAKINILSEVDDKYDTARGIEEITFKSDKVHVRCDDSVGGFDDSISFSFPMSYLALNDNDLQIVVMVAKQ